MMIKTVPIRNIGVNNKYLRLSDNVDELVKSIDTVGIINPLTVNKNYELISGGRRYSALMQLNYDNVPVFILDRNELEEELASIDENLIRRPLNEVEFDNCLRRGNEIYARLNPDARKDDDEDFDSEIPSFSEVVADKIGMSKEAIRRAIKRDGLSSSKVKDARKNRDIGTSHANELIKLNKSEQNDILPYIIEAPKKKLKDIVKDVQEFGTERAIKNVEKLDPLPKDFESLLASSKKLNKIVGRILSDKVHYNGAEKELVASEVKKLKANLNEFLRSYQ